MNPEKFYGLKIKLLQIKILKGKMMKICNVISVFLFGIVILVVSACQSYQAGGIMEQWNDDYIPGVYVGGDFVDMLDYSLIWLPKMFPNGTANNVMGFGFNSMLKVPINFTGNHFSFFPFGEFESRFYDEEKAKLLTGDEIFNIGMGLGLNFGAGLDINFTRSFYLTGRASYQPEFTSWFDSTPGFRFNVGIGYRTVEDPIHNNFKTFRAMRIESALENAK